MNCDNAAVALLTFAPQQAKAWLYDLDEPNPAGGISLCRKHANATVVPMSWQLIDGRDPAWPGPTSSREQVAETGPAVDAAAGYPTPAPASDSPAMPPVSATLPSDSTVLDGEFAALRDALPVTPQPYAEPRVATLRAAGVLTETLPDAEADMSLFQLPLSDTPAVTPHPDYS